MNDNDATVDSRYTFLNSNWWKLGVNVKVARQPKSRKIPNKFNKLQAFTVFVFPTSRACAFPTSERQETPLHGRQTWPYWSKWVPSSLRHYCPPFGNATHKSLPLPFTLFKSAFFIWDREKVPRSRLTRRRCIQACLSSIHVNNNILSLEGL